MYKFYSRSLTYLTALFLSLSGIKCIGNVTKSQPENLETRVLNTCILNDFNNPVNGSLISLALTEVSEDYEKHVGIRLKAINGVQYSDLFNLDDSDKPFDIIMPIYYRWDITTWLIDQASYLEFVSPKKTEIQIIFSNRKMYINQKNSYISDKSEINGESDPYFGYIILYNFEANFSKRDKYGNRIAIKTFKHELGHLFLGHDHNPDSDSFMYYRNSLNRGRWTEFDIFRIGTERNRSWYTSSYAQN